MPATIRKQPTSTTSTPTPQKKRQRQSPPSSVDSSTLPSTQPQPTSISSAPPVLSAVAARRAARLASASASSSPAPQVPTPVKVESKPQSPQPVEVESDSPDSASDVENALLASAQRSKGKGKGKQVQTKKKETPSRYFSGAQEDRMRVDEEEADREYTDEVSELPATPKAARPRRRREKTAFVDPECYSNFRLEESVNAWSTNVVKEDGSNCEGVVYGLRIGEDLVIHGALDLTLLSGSISLLGSSLSSPSTVSELTIPRLSTSTSHRVYSPASHPIPPISALPNDSNSSKPDSLSLYLDAQIDISQFCAVVLITPTQTGIEGIESSLKSGGLGCANGLFPWPSTASGSISTGRSWRLVTDPVPGLTILRQIEPWSSALASLVPSPTDESSTETVADPGRLTVLVEGPKRVGKSTFSKMLLNRLLDRYEAVAYLDTDLGQPEFSTPGFVSLNVLRKPTFGPAFTHLSLPVSSQFLGSTSPASDPTSYMAAISALLAIYALQVEYPLLDEPVPSNPRRRHHYHSQNQPRSSGVGAGGKVRERVPLVINTQGWVKGLGGDLLAKLKAESQPTHVCSFVSPYDSEDNGGYSDGQQPEFVSVAAQEDNLPYRLFTLPAAPSNPLESKWTASDYRTLSFVSYFHSNLIDAPTDSSPSSLFPSTWNFSSPLIAQTPYSLDWKREAGQISSVHLLDGEDIPYENILHVLNGSLVAIVETSSSPDAVPLPSTSSFPYDPTSTVPSPSVSRSLGLGLIRSINPSSTSLHLLTPIPPPSSSISLVKGSLELPLALMLDHTASEAEREQGLKGVSWKDVPFLSVEEGEGAGRRRVRRNLMRRGHA
ncbi:polynucleotide 5'-hydroxyl-kinase [Sporobolomyces salmoneus]|uniref:polynucleotide 5'-hydroxyl-kinase n=1 Tax=Sporobolomyces salmoneus TaxID=183962 RepID=UPI003174C1FF